MLAVAERGGTEELSCLLRLAGHTITTDHTRLPNPQKLILSQEDMLVISLAKKDGLMSYTYNIEMERWFVPWTEVYWAHVYKQGQHAYNNT
jgi:hypothetical protein